MIKLVQFYNLYLQVLTHVVGTGKYREILVSSIVEMSSSVSAFSMNNTGKAKASIVVYKSVFCKLGFRQDNNTDGTL